MGNTTSSYTSGIYNFAAPEPFWNYGVEVWCNLEGRYVTLVADLANLKGTSYEQSLCSFGIMGVKYVRDAPVPKLVVI